MKLLDRARHLMRGLAPGPPAPPQTFDIACPLGHRVSGQRTEGYQSRPCPTCGENIFVLPRSPLPNPPDPAAKKRSRKPVHAPLEDVDDAVVELTEPVSPDGLDGYDIDAEIEWDDTPPATGQKPSQSEAPAHPARSKPPKARPRAEEPEPKPPEIDRPPVRERLTDWGRRHRHLLVFLAVAFVVLGTVGYRIRWTRRQDLPRIAELGRTQGLEALDAGEFDTAHQLLSEARRAVDELGGAYEGASEIRQGAGEAAIIVDLCPGGPEALLTEAGRTDPKSWASRFETLYKGRSILVDALVVALPDEAAGHPRYELDYRVVPDGEADRPPRVGQIDTSGLRIFQSRAPRTGDRVQFGARLASFTFDAESKTWLIGLEPDSGVWITHPKALEALGWPTLDEPEAEARP